MSNSPSTATGTKRKRGSETKFYAVRVGHTTGIYHSWNDCLAQVKGFKGATFKSFTTLTEADAYLKGASQPSTSGVRKFYAVANGRTPGVYTQWSDALEQIKGWQKPVHRSFTTRTEAEAFVRNNAPNGSSPVKGKALATTFDAETARDDNDAEASDRPTKRQSLANGTTPSSLSDQPLENPGWDPLPPDAEDGFDPRLTLSPTTGILRYKTPQESSVLKPQAKVNPATDVLTIYTDGACRANGQKGAIAGLGVWFGPLDPRNVSEALPGARQTNQRAELLALRRALDIAPLGRHAAVYSDSNYAIKCCTEWFASWERNGWLNSSKKPVENRDLVEKVLARIREREAAGSKTKFVWVKGHDNEEGNVQADRLAVEGAMAAGRARGAAAESGTEGGGEEE